MQDKQIGDETADIAEDDATLADRHHDGGKGIVEQDHGGGFARHIGAAQSHGDADIGLAQRRRVVDAVAGHRDDFAGGLIGPHEFELFRRADAGEDIGLHQFATVDPRQRAAFDDARLSLGSARSRVRCYARSPRDRR